MVNGRHVPSLVEMDRRKEGGPQPYLPKMVERHVLAVTRQEDHVISENVQVKENKPM